MFGRQAASVTQARRFEAADRVAAMRSQPQISRGLTRPEAPIANHDFNPLRQM
jgi:hypothetical protein